MFAVMAGLENCVKRCRTVLHAPLSAGMVAGVGLGSAPLAQAAPAAELMIVAEFRLRVGERSFRATLALPSVALLPHLGEAHPEEDPGDAAVRARRHVARALTDVTVELAAAPVTPAEVIGLAVGDVVRLPHHQSRPLDVVVDGHVMARGAVGSSGSRLACRIVTTEEN